MHIIGMDGIIKNTFWNNLWFNKKIKKNQAAAEQAQLEVSLIPEYIKNIEMSKSLAEVLQEHKNLWRLGIHHPNFGPCSYGIFRTRDISCMLPSEVYLGGIWGLTTRNLEFWEKYKNDEYGDNGFGIDPHTSLYEMILNQYKNHIIGNLRAMLKKAKDSLKEYHDSGYKTINQSRI